MQTCWAKDPRGRPSIGHVARELEGIKLLLDREKAWDAPEILTDERILDIWKRNLLTATDISLLRRILKHSSSLHQKTRIPAMIVESLKSAFNQREDYTISACCLVRDLSSVAPDCIMDRRSTLVTALTDAYYMAILHNNDGRFLEDPFESVSSLCIYVPLTHHLVVIGIHNRKCIRPDRNSTFMV
jgi:hypothetical protein